MSASLSAKIELAITVGLAIATGASAAQGWMPEPYGGILFGMILGGIGLIVLAYKRQEVAAQ